MTERCSQPHKRKPGRKPEHLKLSGDWVSAIGKALKKRKPPKR